MNVHQDDKNDNFNFPSISLLKFQDRNKELQYEHSREVKALEGIIQESKQEKIDSRKTQENFIENTRNKMNVLKVISPSSKTE